MLEVAPERLVAWVAGFVERHGAVECSVPGSSEVPAPAVPTSLVLTAADGAIADLEVPWPPSTVIMHSTVIMQSVAELAAHAALPRTTLLVLVRRGGYGAGVARDGELLAHAVGTRYVQGRTAAGGWSQQRFARRRTGQAAVLAGSATEAVVKVLAGQRPEVVVVGGDRALVEEVLSDPRLGRVAALPRAPLLAVPDPRLVVLREVAGRCRAVRVRLTEPRG